MLRHIVHPIIIMRAAPKPRGMRLTLVENLSATPMPSARQDELRREADALVSMGFDRPVYAMADKHCVALLEHSADGALAVVMTVINRSAFPSTLFTTYFRDGWKIATTNTGSVLRTPPLPRVDGARFIGAAVKPLYQMHRARVAERARTTPVEPQRRGDPVAFQDREAREIQDWWVAKGVYRYLDGDRMKMTPLGAALAAWRGLFPWTLISAMRKDRKAHVLATRFGIPISPFR